MKKIAGLRADHVVVVKMEADPTAEVSSLSATIAYLDSRSNENIGYAQIDNVWSSRTQQFLAHLIESMEDDVAERVSEGGILEEPIDGTGGAAGIFPEK